MSRRSSPKSRHVLAGLLVVGLLVVVCLLANPSAAQEANDYAKVKAELHPLRHIFRADEPVWVDFRVVNESDEVVTLTVPGIQAGQDQPGTMGLPLSHIFSGRNFTALRVATAASPHVGRLVSYTPTNRVAPIKIAARGSVGLRVDIAKHYHVFRQAGTYQVSWSAYGGKVESQPVEIRIAVMKQAVMETDCGKITIQFFYEQAPEHVDNFVQLARGGYYDGKIFHRVIPGTMIQGGCPRGNGTGVRPDGKTLLAEFSDLPHVAGTLSMARKPNDPNSASCQFFFCLTRIPEFDGKQTVFGQAVGAESLETLQKLGAAEVTRQGTPVKPPRIHRVTIVDAPATMASSKVQTEAVEPSRMADDR